MEEYVAQCQKAMLSGKREDFPKKLITKLDEQARERQDKALAKASSPPKTKEAIVSTPTTRIATASSPIMEPSSLEEKEKESNTEKRKEMQSDLEAGVEIESDEDTNLDALVIDEPRVGALRESAVTRSVVQSIIVYTSAVPVAMTEETPMDVGAVEEMETESATALDPPTPTPISIYSTAVSSSQIPASTMPTLCPITNCNAIFPNTAVLLYAIGQGPHPSSTAPQVAIVQSTMSSQALISSPIVAPSPPFNTHLDSADMDFSKRKLRASQETMKSTTLSEGQSNSYVKIVATLQRALRE